MIMRLCVCHLLRDTGSVYQDVHFAEVIDDIPDCLKNGVTVSHIHAIEADIGASLLTKLSGSFVANILLNVQDGDTSHADFSDCLCHVQTEAPTGPADTISQGEALYFDQIAYPVMKATLLRRVNLCSVGVSCE